MLISMLFCYKTTLYLYVIHYLNVYTVMINNNYNQQIFNNPALDPLHLNWDKRRRWQEMISQSIVSVRSYIVSLSKISIILNKNIWAVKHHKNIAQAMRVSFLRIVILIVRTKWLKIELLCVISFRSLVS